MYWLVAGFILISTSSLLAQKNSVSGIVIDSDTRLPVPFANVFFASTTIGVSSDQDGKFQLGGFASGKYDLIVTFVGYTNFRQSLEFDNSNVRVSIELVQTPVVLKEVIVREDTTDRARNFIIFKKYFLGETTNSNRCRIINPDVIHLFFDTKTNVLVAHAKEPIQIENNALGYQLNYYLDLFELDFGSGRLTSFGIPSFQNLQARNQLQANRWNKERKRAYQGSLTHFIKALGSDQFKQEGFVVKKLYRKPNPERPSQSVLDARIQLLGSKPRGGKLKSINDDSLSFYRKLQSLPIHIDSLSSTELQANELLTSDKYVKFKGILSVFYKKEQEESEYLKEAGRTRQRGQHSVIHFLSDSLRLYPNGFYQDQKSVFIQNYWAWSEKISDYLPNDYRPMEKQKPK
jgi:hypothetical protein